MTSTTDEPAPRVDTRIIARIACIAPLALVGSAALFVVLFAGAALVYPGGTHFDHAAAGHDFWRNTLCDVARGVALDGRANATGSVLARSAMAILALGVGVLFGVLPSLFAPRRLGAVVRALGATAMLGSLGVVLLPTDRFGAMHGAVIVIAGVPGLVAAVLALGALVRVRPAPLAVIAIGALALVVAGAGFALYVGELVVGGPAQMAVPVLERLATLLVLAWMLAVARAT